MEKPASKTLQLYEYLECSKYLEGKYGYSERDVDNNAPYYPRKDFWGVLCRRYSIKKDCLLKFTRRELELDLQEEPEWVRTVYARYLDEFADENGEVLFRVRW